MDWAGDTTGGLPDQVVSAGTGMRSRTGTILWAQEDVQVEPPHPLRQTAGWPPREGDEVVIDASVDTGQGPYSFRRFTGRLGRTTGSLTDGTLTSEITDTLGDALQASCTVPPIIADARHYMRSHWVAYQALAQADLGTIPGPDAETVLWNGYQGGLNPLIGKFIKSGTEYGDGYGLSSWTGAETAPNSTPRGGKDVLILARAGTSTGAGDPALTVRIGAQVLSLTCDIIAGTYRLHVTGIGTVGSWPRVDDSPLAVLALQILTSGVRVYTSPTTWVTVPSVSVPTSAAVTVVGGTVITGVSVRYMSGAAAPGVVARTATRPVSITRSQLEQERIPATRGVENVTARSVVDAWSEATLGSIWMDEHGKPVVVARDRLVTRPAARTLRIDERVFSGSWSVGDDSVRSRVEVKGQQGAVNRPRAGEFRAVAFQESSARSFSESTEVEKFYEADSEVEWGPISTYLNRAGSQGVGGESEGSWISMVLVPAGSDVEQWAQTNGVSYLASVQRLGHRTLKITESISGVPAGGTVYTRTPSERTNVHPAYRGVPMPLIRAEWLTTWADYLVTGATTGPSWAPPLEHDAGWWLTPGDAQRFADALATEVTQPMPTLSGVSVLWDPRRQIGDVEEWTAVDKTGAESWRARVLVTGYAEAWDGQVPSQSIDVRVISWTDPTSGKTYNDLSKAYTTYAGMTGTYQQVYDALPAAR